MNKTMKYAVLTAAFAAALSTGMSAMACTGLYVGKEVSEDGATIIARTVDCHPLYAAAKTIVVEAQTGVENNMFVSASGNFSYPLPENTYKYVATPFVDSLFGDTFGNACVNEAGLAITGTVTGYIRSEMYEADPMVYEGGLSEGMIPQLIAASCATAREGVELIGEIMATVGNSEQNIVMIADQTEAWYVEMYTGHQWCAVKMPEDMVAVYGNQFMIGTIDPDSEDVMYSEELFSMPEEAGLAVYTEDGQMDIFATYAGEDRLANYANRRTWMGHVLLAPSTAGEYDTYTRYPLFYEPDEKVSVEDVFEVLRNRFEGTQWSPDETGRVDQRVIGTETQGTAHVLEVFDDLPAEMCCVQWACLANSEHSVYLPYSNLVTDFAEAFKYDEGVDAEVTYNTDYASIAFKRLCALAEQDRTYYGAGVREYWHNMELELIEEFPKVLEETAALLETSKEEAEEYITAYTINLQEQAYDDAMAMFDELTWYMICNTDTLKTKFSYSKLTMSDTVTQEPYVPFEDEAE